jgi:5-methylcytosine-specific restriction protein B
MKSLIDLVYEPRATWGERARAAFSEALEERYLRVPDLRQKVNDERRFQLRVNADPKENAVPYAALIGPDQETSGPYGGMSFVMFPADQPGTPALIGMVVGTNGLAPDEAILGRPGHARKCAAIAAWLNGRAPRSAWAKRDPVRIDLGLPRTLPLEAWRSACDRYGQVLYALFQPSTERSAGEDLVRLALTAFLDLFFEERRISPKRAFQNDAEEVRRQYLARVLPDTSADDVSRLLADRRFVVLEGPPGTGKTRMAEDVLRSRYGGHGKIVQFHPSTTYESFVGGLAPEAGGELGFRFAPTPGVLMRAAEEARRSPERRYLLVVDEINRADLAKVLGEAIYLFEPGEPDRSVDLAHEFPGVGRTLRIPSNLDVLGTMNSADRSIAILDIAVRRRFAFVPLWPQLAVVEAHSGQKLRVAFHDLLTIFVEHATDDALALLPGHSYFLGDDDSASDRLLTGVRPLLEEYLAQGYVTGFADEIRAYLDHHTAKDA